MKFRKLAEKIMKLELIYADHKPNCEVKKTKELFNNIAKTAKDCGQHNFSIGAKGVNCSCGYTSLTNQIKIGIRDVLKT